MILMDIGSTERNIGILANFCNFWQFLPSYGSYGSFGSFSSFLSFGSFDNFDSFDSFDSFVNVGPTLSAGLIQNIHRSVRFSDKGLLNWRIPRPSE